VREGKCSVDTRWYLDNQLKEPLTRVFEMVINNTSDIFKVNKVIKPSVGTNSMFSEWVSKKRVSSRDRKAANVEIKRRKITKKAKPNILSFF
jgi:hypothetical protein